MSRNSSSKYSPTRIHLYFPGDTCLKWIILYLAGPSPFLSNSKTSPVNPWRRIPKNLTLLIKYIISRINWLVEKVRGVFWVKWRRLNRSVKINLFKPNILHYYWQCFAIFRPEPWCDQYRTSVVSDQKTESRDFHRPLLEPA